MREFLKHFRGVICFAAMTLNTVFWFVPLLVLALFKVVIPGASARKVLTRWLMSIAENWVAVNAWLLRPAGSRDWRADGIDRLDRRGWYLVVANHQTWVDIIVLQTVFNRRIPLLKFFIKQQLFWFPVLGIGFWALDMPFMKRYSASYLAKHPEKKGRDLEATRRACAKFRETPTSVINFIEGTRFSEQKRDARNSPFTYLLQPRAGGIAAALASMGDMFDAVVDVTLVYPRGVPKFWDMVCGEHVEVVVDVRTREIDPALLEGDYESDRRFRREIHRWLTDAWREKDIRIAEIRARVA